MDRPTSSEDSIRFSSLDSPPGTTRAVSATGRDENIDTDGILVENTFFARTTDGDGYGARESLPGLQQGAHMAIPRNVSRTYVLRCLIALFLVTCIAFVIVDFCGDRKIESILISFLEWTHENPYRGIIAVILCYIVATVFFVPGSILTFGSGFAIGSAVDNTYLGILLAVVSVFIGASIGSICSFLLGRYLFRDCVIQLAFSYPIFQAIERALSTNGLKIMVLLRLSPLIPFNALDYISGITSISLRDYALALVAILPGAIVLCFAGASASSLSDRTASTGSTGMKIFGILSGLLFGGLGVYLVSYYSKMELDRILAEQSEHNSTGYTAEASPPQVVDETAIVETPPATTTPTMDIEEELSTFR